MNKSDPSAARQVHVIQTLLRAAHATQNAKADPCVTLPVCGDGGGGGGPDTTAVPGADAVLPGLRPPPGWKTPGSNGLGEVFTISVWRGGAATAVPLCSGGGCLEGART